MEASFDEAYQQCRQQYFPQARIGDIWRVMGKPDIDEFTSLLVNLHVAEKIYFLSAGAHWTNIVGQHGRGRWKKHEIPPCEALQNRLFAGRPKPWPTFRYVVVREKKCGAIEALLEEE